MIRKISLFLAVILLFSLFALPVHAEVSLSDLSKIYNNLRDYLYTPDYRDSEFYPAYDEIMQKIKGFLVSDNITQDGITKHYTELKTCYANMMKDTYDYSSLEGLVTAYEQLPSSLFTPESFKKLQTAYEAAETELAAPTLFVRGNKTTSQMYREYTNEHIQKFTTSFKKAFNGLVLVDEPASPDREYLENYTKFISFCARAELLGNTPEWTALENAINNAEKAALGTKKRRETALKNLKEAYKAACDASFDFSAAEKILDAYKELSQDNYTASTWTRYEQSITDLQFSLSKLHFFFIPLNADENTCKEMAKEYLDSIAEYASEKEAELVPMDSFEKLSVLCKNAEKTTAEEGLEIKLNQLLKKVEEGKELLKNESATKFDVDKAITDIEDALDTLRFAEKHLLEERDSKVVQDSKTVQYTLIFCLSSLCLAAVFAIYLSYRHYDKVDWTK